MPTAAISRLSRQAGTTSSSRLRCCPGRRMVRSSGRRGIAKFRMLACTPCRFAECLSAMTVRHSYRTVAATTAAADSTGIVLASVVAPIGFFILPAKRQRAKEEMRRKIGDVRQRLSEALKKQFAQEIERSGDRIRESIAPYSRFIRAEGDKLQAVDLELKEIAASIARVREQIERPAA